MATDKRINYNVQGNVKNYLGKQKIVKAPLHWQSSPDHPTTELAYITKKEKDLILKKDLHKSLKGGVNRGPSGIMSLNGWGDRPSSTAPGQQSGPETGKSFGDQERSVTSAVPGGGTKTTTVSPQDTFAQSWSGPKRFFGLTGGYRDLKTPGDTSGGYQSRIGGIGRGIGRGLLSIFGGIPGRVASGLMTAKNLAKRTGAKIGEFGEEVEEFGQYPTHDRWLNRYTDKYKDKPYRGQGQGYNFAEGGRIGYERGRVVNPGGYAGYLDRNIANLEAALKYSDLTPEDRAQVEADLQEALANKGGWEDKALGGDPVPKDAVKFWEGQAEGGRAGYQGGELVEDESMMEATPAGMMEENIEEVQGEPSREQLEAIAFEIFKLPLEELDEQQLRVVYQAAMEQEPSEEEVQFAAQEGPPEGIASLV